MSMPPRRRRGRSAAVAGGAAAGRGARGAAAQPMHRLAEGHPDDPFEEVVFELAYLLRHYVSAVPVLTFSQSVEKELVFAAAKACGYPMINKSAWDSMRFKGEYRRLLAGVRTLLEKSADKASHIWAGIASSNELTLTRMKKQQMNWAAELVKLAAADTDAIEKIEEVSGSQCLHDAMPPFPMQCIASLLLLLLLPGWIPPHHL